MTIFGTQNNDRLLGSVGNDIFVSSPGNDVIIGGNGFDTVDYSNFRQAISLFPRGGIGKGSFGTDQILNVERIIAPNVQGNTINAASGSGGASLNVDLSQNRLTVNNIPTIGSLNFQVVNFTNVLGTANRDKVIGNNFNNTIDGFAGHDSLFGAGGNDLLIGSAGNDLVVGDAGNDILLGSNQFSRGKGEFDILVGGSNNDAFILGDRSGSYYGFAGNADYAQISDLSRGDVIQLGIGETYFARPDAAGFDLFVARGSVFDLVADVRSTFAASLPVGTFKLASGQSWGIFLGA
ncbi:calcium-binding protein [Calothrix sp. FACHB-1219]|uniref:calcium-binding protein n=1 Tax=unclassified Calothrix TaxID=2619626 RepID=UPI0016894C29|nr:MULTISPECIES: calcium-binding protein [unclassified Calothrix]MBD2203701.1 calcium-binding protein [Calothrix sp. FACHB-168]MBD2222077.1 calcium-binding protein [Calothrix sp. FACHB-1219]